MKAIYSVHMPLFIAVSGYLYWFSMQSHGSVQSALRRIRQLLPVCIVWGIALWLLRIASGKSGDFKSLARLCITDFWFLWTLMIAACVASLVECVAPRKALARIRPMKHGATKPCMRMFRCLCRLPMLLSVGIGRMEKSEFRSRGRYQKAFGRRIIFWKSLIG